MRPVFRHSLLGIIALSSFSIPASAMAKPAQEDLVRAAIIYNLARFTEWPETDDTSADFNICSLTDKNMEKAIAGLKGKKIRGRSLQVTHLKNNELKDQRCTVIYVSGAEKFKKIDQELIEKEHILAIGDSAKFLESGGHMSILKDQSRLRFSINSKAMETSHIKPSSKILRLAIEPSE